MPFIVKNRLAHSLTFLFLCFATHTFSQSPDQEPPEKPEPPEIPDLRAEEDFSHLKDPEKNPYQKGFGDALKYISLNKRKSIYFNVGGEYRVRVEHFTNRDWTEENATYYSQRVVLNSNLVLGKHVRLFGELYHGYITLGEEFVQSDHLDLHQGFLELLFPIGEQGQLSARFGRQEKEYGASRLVGLRDGPNIRRSFDMASVTFQRGKLSVEGLYGREVRPAFGVFDNASGIFNATATTPEMWGVYVKFPVRKLAGNNEVYYLGYRSPFAFFSDVGGEEIRHTFGLRRFGRIGKFSTFNTELIVQLGDLGGNAVRAFDFEADWKQFLGTSSKLPIIGLKLDWSSGDRETGDGVVQTFNPYFVNPAIYSLAGVNTPANLISVHPNITLVPRKGITIYIDYAFLFRSTLADGLYAPPNFQIRPAGGLDAKPIGGVAGLVAGWTINRNLKLDLMSSYYVAGDYIEASGDAENTFFISPTLNFLF